MLPTKFRARLPEAGHFGPRSLTGKGSATVQRALSLNPFTLSLLHLFSWRFSIGRQRVIDDADGGVGAT